MTSHYRYNAKDLIISIQHSMTLIERIHTAYRRYPNLDAGTMNALLNYHALYQVLVDYLRSQSVVDEQFKQLLDGIRQEVIDVSSKSRITPFPQTQSTQEPNSVYSKLVNNGVNPYMAQQMHKQYYQVRMGMGF